MPDSNETLARGRFGAERRGRSRRAFLASTAAGGAALSGAGLLATPALGANRPSPGQDRTILNFALLLEYLQVALYRQALRRRAIKGELREFAEAVGEQEQQHVDFLRGALGQHARGEPRFDFGAATRSSRRFLRSAVIVEDAAIAAYNGQAANLTKPALAPALRIVSVEGRHAAWIRDIAGDDPAPLAADPGRSAPEVIAILRRNRLLVTR